MVNVLDGLNGGYKCPQGMLRIELVPSSGPISYLISVKNYL